MSRTIYLSTPSSAGDHALESLFKEAKKEERKDRALAVSIRLEALAVHITNSGMTGKEAAELLRREATRFENESQELH
ncbi:DUF2732 family protein [Citrobacter freundii]|uniref:DUF2732 family protein n=1 Tax=Citrobacter TaxID=544 RepID=UPI000FD6DA93|nr:MULTISPECIES: DUF2732 family protein [Citrobacter]EBD4887155.1 DUF2732 domain-containing protein [Salmonella enterica]ECY5830211.1 DUF2732 domain-containing protein [Salmonella enterica subsp. enterica serovar Give]EDJ7639050.1 hypothetical protein [Salmonella enterica subsp. enterica serovar Senftenberg]EBU3783419.1 DUF2732 domain-containing protein [Salmonella enterica]ELA3501438.1 DUF2732 domain-containing protein [Salmonella enterica]